MIMRKVYVRLDNLADQHVQRLAAAMGATDSEAIRTIIHRDCHMAAYMDAAVVHLKNMQTARSPPPVPPPSKPSKR